MRHKKNFSSGVCTLQLDEEYGLSSSNPREPMYPMFLYPFPELQKRGVVEGRKLRLCTK